MTKTTQRFLDLIKATPGIAAADLPKRDRGKALKALELSGLIHYGPGGWFPILFALNVTIPEIGTLGANTQLDLMQTFSEARDAGGYGASDIGAQWPVTNSEGARVGILSYNGRLAIDATTGAEWNRVGLTGTVQS